MYTWNDGTDYLMHHGVKGQKWGIRLYQNPDGSLTELGKIHYGRKFAKYDEAINRKLKEQNHTKLRAEKEISRMNEDANFDSKAAKRRFSAAVTNWNAEKLQFDSEVQYDKAMDKFVQKFGEESVDQLFNSKAYKFFGKQSEREWKKAVDFLNKYSDLRLLNDKKSERAEANARKDFEEILEDTSSRRYSDAEKADMFIQYLQDPSGWEKKQYRQREKENRGDRLAGQSWGVHGSSGRYPFI